MNIFTDEYCLQEIAFMAIPEDGINVMGATTGINPLPFGRLDNYLSVEFRAEPLDIPTYRLDGGLWMSITPMEVQSMWVPIQHGRKAKTVGIGGLGMGYVALRIAESDTVESIDIYEEDERCIAMFAALHGQREGFRKFKFICGDCRELMQDKVYDFVFMDIYQNVLEDAIIQSIEVFNGLNEIGEYRFWGQELAMYLSIEYGAHGEDIAFNSSEAEGSFFSQFFDSECSSMRPPLECGDFADECIEAIWEHAA